MTSLNRYNDGRGGMPGLLGWDPFRMFDELMSWQPLGGQNMFQTVAAPIHIANTDDGSTISVDMPGVEPQDVELTLQSGSLTITGKRGEQTYRYVVTLGDELDPDRIEAQLDKGVLTVHAPKREDAKPRKIALKVAGAQKTLDSGEAK